ncbi:MAG: PorP/SprF family type IX secretion system membrane protein [Bacteroidota bacterium]
MKIIKKIFFVGFLCIGINANSQDPHFSQFYSNPLALNPAFAGSAGCARVALNYRLQWPELSGGGYKTFSISYDQYSNAVKGGFGFNYMYDNSHNMLFNHYANVYYAYNIKCSENLLIKPAVNIGMGRKSIDESLFLPPIDLPFNPRFFFNAGVGVLATYKNLTSGFAFDHINKPNVGFMSTSRLPVKITAHASYQFSIKNILKVTPIVIFQKQQDFEALIPSFLFNIWNIKFGAGLRTGFENPDSFISMIGFQNNKISIGYSYDLTISKLSNATGGSHEISAVFKFNCKNKLDKLLVPLINNF